MKRKLVTAILCSMAITASMAGGAAAASADMNPGMGMGKPEGSYGEPMGEMSQGNSEMQDSQMGMAPQGAPEGQAGGTRQETPGGQAGGTRQGTPEGQAGGTRQGTPEGQAGGTRQETPEGQAGKVPKCWMDGRTQDGRGTDSHQAATGAQGGQPGQMREDGDPDLQQKENATIGKVTAINGNSVTVSVLKDGNEESLTFDLGDASITKVQGGRGMGGSRQNGQEKPENSGQTPQEKPGDSGSTEGSGQAAPGKPGDSGSTEGSGQAAPEKPGDGNGTDSSTQLSPGKPEAAGADGEAPKGEGASVSDIAEGDIIEVEQDENGKITSVMLFQDMQMYQDSANPAQPGGTMPGQPGEGGMPGGPGGASQPTEYAAASTLEEDSEGADYGSATGGESAVLVDGREVSLSNTHVNKTGDSSGEDADFYGTNAAILAVNGGTLSISGADISTDGTHANAVFSYGEGTRVNISDSTITTTGNNSGGLMTTGGGTMDASNLTVSTSGNSSASIRSDRGGGTVSVNGGSYNTSGTGSPSIYSTADINVADAVLTASNSEAVVIEGGNSVSLDNVDATGNDATLNGQSTIKTNVLIYQSMSGDASMGTASFSMSGGSMTSQTGCMFHVTNTTTAIDLSGVDFTYAEDSSDFIIISEDSWGQSGSNGGHVTLNLDAQAVSGDAVVDKSSDLALSLKNGSSYTGAINSGNSGADISVSLEEGSTWTLTGDSYITSFDGDPASVVANGYHLYVNGTAVA